MGLSIQLSMRAMHMQHSHGRALWHTGLSGKWSHRVSLAHAHSPASALCVLTSLRADPPILSEVSVATRLCAPHAPTAACSASLARAIGTRTSSRSSTSSASLAEPTVSPPSESVLLSPPFASASAAALSAARVPSAALAAVEPESARASERAPVEPAPHALPACMDASADT